MCLRLSASQSVCLCRVLEWSVRRLWLDEDVRCRRLDDDEMTESARWAARWGLSASRLGPGLNSASWTWTLWMSEGDGIWGGCMSSSEEYEACPAHAELEGGCRKLTLMCRPCRMLPLFERSCFAVSQAGL